jgi:hypothetical protein
MDTQLLDLLQKLEQRLDVIQISIEQLSDQLHKLEHALQGEIVIDEDFTWD